MLKPILKYATPTLIIAGLWLISFEFWPENVDKFSKCRSSPFNGVAEPIGGPFTLINQKGIMVTDADVITEPSLIYFGYTFCPDVCPLDAVRNTEVVNILAQTGKSLTPIFISIDPQRDKNRCQ